VRLAAHSSSHVGLRCFGQLATSNARIATERLRLWQGMCNLTAREVSMRRVLMAALAASSLISGGTLAQEPQQSEKPVTILVGCLRESRADTATANTKGVIYTLEADTQKLPTSPAPEGSGPIKVDGRYALSFEDSVDLSKHVNHKVEVWGRLLPRPTRDAQTAAKPLPGAAEQMFHVTTLKMVAATCP
jgi:hypothetical protein